MPVLCAESSFVICLTALLFLSSVFGEVHPRSNASTRPERPGSLLARMAEGRKNLRPLVKDFLKAIRARQQEQAEALCHRMIDAAPSAPTGYYNLACLHARRGERGEAFQRLEQAIDRGFNNVLHLKEDPDLFSLHDEFRFVALVEKAAAWRPKDDFKAVPFPVISQTAWVEDSNVSLHPELRIPFATYRFGPKIPEGRKVTGIGGPVGKLLQQWFKEGTAAGNWGDLYDNRDGNHSNLRPNLIPQMTWIEYSDHAKDAMLHWGLASSIVHSGVVLGNASVAQTSGPFWRSMPRLAHGNQQSADYVYWQYTHNKLYVYPGHVDFPRDEKELKEKKRRDVFPANSAYLIASQGSSGKDKPFLRAFAATMAAFRPGVKKLLVERRILAPTLQFLLRRTNKPVLSEQEYLTGLAHPIVFPGANIDIEKMIALAHEMTADAVPPLVRIRVKEEMELRNGRDYFAAPDRTEKLFDTPCAVARVFRGHQRLRKMVVSAESSSDVNGRPLTFHWTVLQGDAKAIRIRPLNEAGSVVELVVPYLPRRSVGPASGLESSRIDIGAFVHNGVYYSAPAFITFYSLDNEQREYDGQGRIRSITYRGAKEKAEYTDPVVALPKSWRDEFHYDEQGNLTGWTRLRGKEKQEFTARGDRIIRRDAAGKVIEKRKVKYVVRPRKPNQAPALVQVDE